VGLPKIGNATLLRLTHAIHKSDLDSMRSFYIRISLKTSPNPPSDIHTPKSLFDKLPSHKPRPAARQNAIFNPKRKDYRFGPIRIDWADIRMNAIAGKEKNSIKGAPHTYAAKLSSISSSLGPIEATFVPGGTAECGSTNLPSGTVHLYRQSSPEQSSSPAKLPENENVTMDVGIMLAVLAVPSWMTPSDFLNFVAPASSRISHLRIIRDSVPNRSLAVIKFPDPKDAVEFTEAYNGRPFNSMEVSYIALSDT
jgi:BRCA1-associated protein